MCNEVNTETPLFCPVPDCPHYQKTDNKITKDGVYTTKSDPTPRQMFLCNGGNHRFSETRYSDLFGKQGSFKEYEMAGKMNCYGLSSDHISDVFHSDTRTIETWLNAIGKKAEQFHIFVCLALQLNLLLVQMDELWSFVGSKSHQLWVFIGIDAPTKFWINFDKGSRTISTANRLVLQIKRFGNWTNGTIVKFTTDKLAAYKNALNKYFVEIPQSLSTNSKTTL